MIWNLTSSIMCLSSCSSRPLPVLLAGWRDHAAGEVHHEPAKGESGGCLPHLHQWKQDPWDESDNKVTNLRVFLLFIFCLRFGLTDSSLEQMVWPDIPETRFIASTQEKFSSRLRCPVWLVSSWGTQSHTVFTLWKGGEVADLIVCILSLCYRFQIRHEDFRQRIAVEDEDITRYNLCWGVHKQGTIFRFHNFHQHFSSYSILNWYKLADAVFLDHLSQVMRIFEFRAFTLFSQDIKRTNSSAVWRYLIGTTTSWTKCKNFFSGYKNLLRAIENLGIAVVYGIRYLSPISVEWFNFVRYYGQGNITEDNYIQFIKHDTLSSEYLNQSKNFVVYVRENFEILKNQGSEYWTWQSSREQVISVVWQNAILSKIRSGKSRNPDTEEAYQFYLSTYRYTEDLRLVLSNLRVRRNNPQSKHISMQGRISQIVGNELNSANEQQGLGVAVLVLVLIISPVIIFLVRSATITIQVMSGILV